MWLYFDEYGGYSVQPVSSPPTISCHMKNAAPAIQTYQLSRLIFGNAMSFAPIIIGTKKFPSTPGMTGIRNRKIMIVPWAVNALLYWSSSRIAPVGEIRLSRTSMMARPPNTKNALTKTRYSQPIRLWSTVNSQDHRLYPSFR